MQHLAIFGMTLDMFENSAIGMHICALNLRQSDSQDITMMDLPIGIDNETLDCLHILLKARIIRGFELREREGP
jgi:hypothetical protein